VRVKAACSPIDEPQYRIDGGPYPQCATWRRAVIDELKGDAPDLIIVSGSKSGSPDSELRVLQALAVIAPTVVIEDTPSLPVSAPKCLRTSDGSHCSWPLQTLQNPAEYPTVAATDLPTSITVLDLDRTVCPHGQCSAMANGRLTRFDEQHFTSTFSRAMAPAIELLLGQQGR
jgi:hypothetical protein